MPLNIIRNDITKVKADIIVNSANPKPIVGRGTDKAIYNAAGQEELLAERKKIGDIEVGDAYITPAFNLDAKYIIHTVGPAYQDGKHHEKEDLISCYKKSLQLAIDYKCSSIAFPIISSGTYRFPKGQAVTIAMATINEFLVEHDLDLDVILVVFDPESVKVSNKLFDSINEFIDDLYVNDQHDKEYRNANERAYITEELYSANIRELNVVDSQRKPIKKPKSTKAFTMRDINKLGAISFVEHKDKAKPFKDLLMDIMIEKDLTDSEVYHNANIKKQTFGKIKNNSDYHPSKMMVLSLAISLKLSFEETLTFLARADYAFNPAREDDWVIFACIKNKEYNINLINIMLENRNLPILCVN